MKKFFRRLSHGKWHNIQLRLLKPEPNSKIQWCFKHNNPKTGSFCSCIFLMHRVWFDENGKVVYGAVILRIG